jgi:hypothetical protein
MSEKPTEWNLRPSLMQLSIGQLLDVTNEALNRLTMRDMAEIFYMAGVEINGFELRDKQEDGDT